MTRYHVVVEIRYWAYSVGGVSRYGEGYPGRVVTMYQGYPGKSGDQVNVNKPCMTSRKTAFPKDK